MKKYLVPLFVFCLTTVAYATPPQDLKVTYSAGTLDVTMKHITIEPREHFIRTIKVTVNGGEPQIFHYPFQKKPTEFAALIPILLNPADKVVVRAECKLGGSAQAELTIPAADQVEK